MYWIMCAIQRYPNFIYNEKDRPLGLFIGYEDLNKTVIKKDKYGSHYIDDLSG